MGSRVPVDDFSVMTGLTRDAMREYREAEVLVPCHIDAHSGYRLYDTTQVAAARAIRRLRTLGVTISGLRTLAAAGDPADWATVLMGNVSADYCDRATAHARAETLRGLEVSARGRARVTRRHESPLSGWMVSSMVTADELGKWSAATRRTLAQAQRASNASPAGPCVGLIHRDVFVQSTGPVRILMPLNGRPTPPQGVEWATLPPADVAVTVHVGNRATIDRSYGTLGVYVADHLEGDDGPLRERYLSEPAAGQARTEICWPLLDFGAAHESARRADVLSSAEQCLRQVASAIGW